MEIKTKYGTYKNCSLNFTKYACDQNALIITDEYGAPILKASVAIPEYSIADDEIFIKNWLENEGILDELIKLGIIEHTGIKLATGHVYADLCRILEVKND